MRLGDSLPDFNVDSPEDLEDVVRSTFNSLDSVVKPVAPFILVFMINWNDVRTAFHIEYPNHTDPMIMASSDKPLFAANHYTMVDGEDIDPESKKRHNTVKRKKDKAFRITTVRLKFQRR
jgi:hypothetical protein